MAHSSLELLINDHNRYSLAFGEGLGASESEIIAISERQKCGFKLVNRDPVLDYVLSIGDTVVPSFATDTLIEPDASVGGSVWWKDDWYFESGVGVVYANIYCRPTDEESDWRRAASLRVNVLPEKIGSERYAKMFEDVSKLSAALVFDLVSKNTRQLSFRGYGIAYEPCNVQLRRIEDAWERIEPAFVYIRDNPTTRIERRQVQTSDITRLNGRSLASALSRGTHPHNGSARFSTLTSAESTDVYEHDLLKTFLLALIERISDCKRYATQLQEELRGDYPKFFTPELAADIVARDFTPRLAKLAEMIDRCESLIGQVRRVLNWGLFTHAKPTTSFRESPVFRNVKSYNALFREALSFRNRSSWSLDTGQQERIKLTSRLYEHWLFIQIAAALVRLGFSCSDSEHFFSIGCQHRFVLDIERGTSLNFRLGGRTMLRLRYEPWILPKDPAERTGEFLYAPSRDPWNPDITMEFFRLRPNGEIESIEYLAVIDAKYSSSPSRQQRDKVGRYAMIRSLMSRQPIARQVWIAFPSDSLARISDDSISWGSVSDPTEFVEGIVGIRPDRNDDIPKDLLRFLKEILSFRGLDDLDLVSEAWSSS